MANQVLFISFLDILFFPDMIGNNNNNNNNNTNSHTHAHIDIKYQ